MNANKAIELGFADGVLADEKKQVTHDDVVFSFSRRAVTNSLLNKVQRKQASNTVNTLLRLDRDWKVGS